MYCTTDGSAYNYKTDVLPRSQQNKNVEKEANAAKKEGAEEAHGGQMTVGIYAHW